MIWTRALSHWLDQRRKSLQNVYWYTYIIKKEEGKKHYLVNNCQPSITCQKVISQFMVHILLDTNLPGGPTVHSITKSWGFWPVANTWPWFYFWTMSPFNLLELESNLQLFFFSFSMLFCRRFPPFSALSVYLKNKWRDYKSKKTIVPTDWIHDWL